MCGQELPYYFGVKYWMAGILSLLLLFQKVAVLNTEQYYKVQTNNLQKVRNLYIRLLSPKYAELHSKLAFVG